MEITKEVLQQGAPRSVTVARLKDKAAEFGLVLPLKCKRRDGIIEYLVDNWPESSGSSNSSDEVPTPTSTTSSSSTHIAELTSSSSSTKSSSKGSGSSSSTSVKTTTQLAKRIAEMEDSEGSEDPSFEDSRTQGSTARTSKSSASVDDQRTLSEVSTQAVKEATAEFIRTWTDTIKMEIVMELGCTSWKELLANIERDRGEEAAMAYSLYVLKLARERGQSLMGARRAAYSKSKEEVLDLCMAYMATLQDLYPAIERNEVDDEESKEKSVYQEPRQDARTNRKQGPRPAETATPPEEPEIEIFDNRRHRIKLPQSVVMERRRQRVPEDQREVRGNLFPAEQRKTKIDRELKIEQFTHEYGKKHGFGRWWTTASAQLEGYSEETILRHLRHSKYIDDELWKPWYQFLSSEQMRDLAKILSEFHSRYPTPISDSSKQQAFVNYAMAADSTDYQTYLDEKERLYREAYPYNGTEGSSRDITAEVAFLHGFVDNLNESYVGEAQKLRHRCERDGRNLVWQELRNCLDLERSAIEARLRRAKQQKETKGRNPNANPRKGGGSDNGGPSKRNDEVCAKYLLNECNSSSCPRKHPPVGQLTAKDKIVYNGARKAQKLDKVAPNRERPSKRKREETEESRDQPAKKVPDKTIECKDGKSCRFYWKPGGCRFKHTPETRPPQPRREDVAPKGQEDKPKPQGGEKAAKGKGF